ncbi:MAG TPA: RIP metalloprotease RseP, partial [Planctomycetota bacterium]|nr:RIP metalloprotease RseP [Planctomycetota bacterium]
VARWIGARVEVFSLGFGPRLFGWRRGATDYRVALVPVGGFVQVAGQDPADRRYPAEQCLWSKTPGQRILFYAGGVAMNMLFALVTFPLVFRVGVPFDVPEVGDVVAGGAAWEAGLEADDAILAVNGKATYSFENLMVEVALTGQRPVVLKVRRGSDEFEVVVKSHFEPERGMYGLGILPATAPEPPRLEVPANGPAARVGLRADDRLLAIDGHSGTARELAAAMATLDLASGAPVAVRVRRGDAELSFLVSPEARAEPSSPLINVRSLPRLVLGIRPGLRALTALDLRRGDALLTVDGNPYLGPDLASVRTGGDRLELRVRRDGKEVPLSAPVTAAERQQLPDHLELGTDPDCMLLLPTPDGAAARAGMLSGDRLLAVDGHPVSDWSALQRSIKSTPAGQAVHLSLQRGGQQLELQVVPQRRPEYDLGFTPLVLWKSHEVRETSFGGAIRSGCVCALDLVKQLYVTLKKLVTGEVAAKNLGGIITISRVSYAYAQSGWSRFLYFLALLSINLAFINVLPIPVLDGGHLLFLLIEKIKGSPVSARVFTYSQVLGLIFVLALLVFVTYNDIVRWLFA